MERLIGLCRRISLTTPQSFQPARFGQRCFTTTTGTSTELFSQVLKDEATENTSTQIVKKSKGRTRLPDEAWAHLRKLPVSTRKLNIVANIIPGLPYREAIAQLTISEQRIAKEVIKCIQSARYNAENNHNLDPEKLVVHDCWIGKDFDVKDIRVHAKGRRAIMRHPFSQFHVILKQVEDPDRYFLEKMVKKKRSRRNIGKLLSKYPDARESLFGIKQNNEIVNETSSSNLSEPSTTQ